MPVHEPRNPFFRVPKDPIPSGRHIKEAAMPKIKIKDLPEDMKISEEELAKVRGGMGGNPTGGLPPGRPAGTAMDCANIKGPSSPAAGKMWGPWRCM